MERPIFKPIGTSVDEIDTPSLVVDIDKLEANINLLHSSVGDGMARIRPQVDMHHCPAIGHMQLEAGGTVDGIAVTTLGQAEVFAQYGFSDILIANLIVGAPKIARLSSLARRTTITVAVDSEQNVRELANAVAGSTGLRLVIAISTAPDRFGAQPGKVAMNLAALISKTEGVDFAGLMESETPILEKDTTLLADLTRQRIQPLLDTREQIENSGITVDSVIAGGSYNYEIVAKISGVTEVPAGRYALMDVEIGSYLNQFSNAARINAVVTSRPEDDVAIVDAGRKAIGSDTGTPSVDVPGAIVKGLSAEHGTLILDSHLPEIGDRIWFTPYNIGECTNLHDFIHVIKNDKLNAVWDLPSRGLYR